MKMKFMLLKDSDEKCRKHSKSDNKETMTGFDTEDTLHRYYIDLAQWFKNKNVIIACVLSIQ